MNEDRAGLIAALKKNKNALILVHNYQRPEIQDIADVLGDSLDLSRKAANDDHPVIVFCGVHFMAETAKILSPDKTVLLPRLNAGCPMAEMADPEGLKRLKAEHPGAKVVTYVNSTARVKAESDVCCTSANAVSVVKNIDADTVIFAPDRNLASWVQRFTDKKIIPWDGFCYVHQRFTVDEVRKAREAHPDAVFLVHPECPKEVADLADEVRSTSGMLRFAGETASPKIIVGTEEGMLYRLKKENPGKIFLTLGSAKACRGMKTTHIQDVVLALEKNRYAIDVPESVAARARLALERMLQYA
ncbi:quinolinate synthase NadA [bacterium]|nr:quinolinate synthase NadA [bacterium]